MVRCFSLPSRLSVNEMLIDEIESQPNMKGQKQKVQTVKKSPLGIESRQRWLSNRIGEIRNAINRYTDANMEIPQEWIEEYHDLCGTMRRIK